MKKTLLVILGILVLLPVLLLLVVVIFVDPIVRSGIEKGGSHALQVPVHLKAASIGLFSGKASLSEFAVANPPGYTEPRSVSFGRIDTQVRPSTLLHDVVEIGVVTVVKPELTLEFTGTKSNWSTLMDNLSSGKSETKGEKPAAPGKKFIIHRLRIEEAGARFRSDVIPGGGTTVTLPSIDLENVGTAEGGATLGEVLNVILHRLGDAALKAGQGIVPTELLNNLGASLKENLKTLQNLPSKSVEELQKNLPDPEKLKKGAKDYIHRP